MVSNTLLEKFSLERDQKPLDTVAVITGSQSDFSKISNTLIELNSSDVSYVLSALSAHRTPEELTEVINAFPHIHVPAGLNMSLETTTQYSKSNVNVKLILAAAWVSAHLAGVIASQTQIPTLAYPVDSSTSQNIDSTFSMVNMPPGIPNGFVVSQEVASEMIKNIMALSQDRANSIYIPNELLDDNTKKLIDTIGINITSDKSTTDIWIYTNSISNNSENEQPSSRVPIIIPTQDEVLDFNNVWDKLLQLNKLQGVAMGINNASKISTKNAIIFWAQLMWMFDTQLVERLKTYRQDAWNDVITANNKLFQEQFPNIK